MVVYLSLFLLLRSQGILWPVESILRSQGILWTTTLWKVMCAATAQGEDGPGQPATRNGMHVAFAQKLQFHMENGGAPYADIKIP